MPKCQFLIPTWNLKINLKRYESVIYCPSAKFKIYTKEV